MEFELTTLAGLALSALVAGFIDAIAGGGGLITLPALLAAGLTPAQALGTNKLQSSFGSFSATWYFARRGYIAFRQMRLAILLTPWGLWWYKEWMPARCHGLSPFY